MSLLRLPWSRRLPLRPNTVGDVGEEIFPSLLGLVSLVGSIGGTQVAGKACLDEGIRKQLRGHVEEHESKTPHLMSTGESEAYQPF